MRKELLFVLVAAFILRFVSLNQSLWLDEATTANVVRTYNYSQIITQFSPHDFHPPLYYLTLKSWTYFFGYSEIALRFPSVLFSLLTGWTVYLIGKKIRNENAGCWAALFFLFNPLIVYYSQEARMYMMVTFTLTVSLYLFLERCHPELVSGSDIRSRNKFGMTKCESFLLFNFFIFLSFITFYGSVFLIVPFYIYLIYKKRFDLLAVTIPGFLLALVIVSPLLLKQFTNAREALRFVANWSLVLGKANLKNLFLVFIKFTFGRISFNPKVIYWGISGVWTLIIWSLAIKGGLKNKFLFYLVIGSLVIGLSMSFFTPLLQYFRFLYLLPILSLLLVFGTDKKWEKIILAVGFFILSAAYLFNPMFHREDWKNLVKNLPSNTVYMIISSSDPLQYYGYRIKIKDLRMVRNDKTKEQKLYVVPYTSDIHGLQYRQSLDKNGYSLFETKDFRGVSYEVWQR